MAMRRQAGFSLIELMVSAALMLILMIGVTRAFTTQQRTYIVVDQVTEAQQNLRAVGDLVERDVRRAGFMVPSNAAVCAYDDTDGPDTLFVSNTDVIRTVYDLEDVNASLTGNKGAKVSGAGSTFDATGASFSLTLEETWVDYNDTGTTADDVDFAVRTPFLRIALEEVEDRDPRIGDRVRVVVAIDRADVRLASFEIERVDLEEGALDEVDGLRVERRWTAREVGLADDPGLVGRVHDHEIVRGHGPEADRVGRIRLARPGPSS